MRNLYMCIGALLILVGCGNYSEEVYGIKLGMSFFESDSKYSELDKSVLRAEIFPDNNIEEFLDEDGFVKFIVIDCYEYHTFANGQKITLLVKDNIIEGLYSEIDSLSLLTDGEEAFDFESHYLLIAKTWGPPLESEAKIVMEGVELFKWQFEPREDRVVSKIMLSHEKFGRPFADRSKLQELYVTQIGEKYISKCVDMKRFK